MNEDQKKLETPAVRTFEKAAWQRPALCKTDANAAEGGSHEGVDVTFS